MENMVPYQGLKTEADRIREDTYEDTLQELLDLGIAADEAEARADLEAENAYQAYWAAQH